MTRKARREGLPRLATPLVRDNGELRRASLYNLGWSHFQGVFVGVHPGRELDPEAFDAMTLQTLGVSFCGLISGSVSIISQIDSLRLIYLEGLKMIVGKAFGSVNASDVAQAVDPRGQRINNAFGQDDVR